MTESHLATLNLKMDDVFLAQGTLRPDLIESASKLARFLCCSVSPSESVLAQTQTQSRHIIMILSWFETFETLAESLSPSKTTIKMRSGNLAKP